MTRQQEENALDCALCLRTLSHYLRAQSLFEPSRLRAPSPQPAYLHSLAVALCGGKASVLPQQKLQQILRGLGVVLVPSLGTGTDRKVPSSFAVHLTESDHRFLVMDLGAPPATFANTLARACAYFLSLHALTGTDAQAFQAGLASILAPLDAPSAAAAENMFSVLFPGTVPDAKSFVDRCEELFASPVFKAIRQYQKASDCRDHAFVARTFCTAILDGYSLSAALMPGLDWDAYQERMRQQESLRS